MIQGKLLSFGDDLKEALEIRRKVFIEELGSKDVPESDPLDNEAVHAVIYEEENQPIATGRLIYNGDSCRIDKIAVLKQYRNKEYGDFTVRLLINRAFTAGIGKVLVDTREDLTGFFVKLGFHVVEKKDNSRVTLLISIEDMRSCCHKI